MSRTQTLLLRLPALVWAVRSSGTGSAASAGLMFGSRCLLCSLVYPVLVRTGLFVCPPCKVSGLVGESIACVNTASDLGQSCGALDGYKCRLLG